MTFQPAVWIIQTGRSTLAMITSVGYASLLIADSRIPILDLHYETEEQARGTTIDAAVVAMEKALGTVANQLGRDINKIMA